MKVDEELLGMFWLLDYKGFIHIPKSDPWSIWGSADDLASVFSMKRLATKGLMGDSMQPHVPVHNTNLGM